MEQACDRFLGGRAADGFADQRRNRQFNWRVGKIICAIAGAWASRVKDFA
jgi:hypothetical protein